METPSPEPPRVVALFSDKPSAAPLPADEEVIQALEVLLADARAGQIVAFTGAVYNGAGHHQLLAIGKVSLANSLGTLSILKHALLKGGGG